MVNEGGGLAQRTFSFSMRLLVSLILPAWGLAMIVLRARSAAGWWIATGVVVLLIGAIFFAGTTLVTPFCREVENSVRLACANPSDFAFYIRPRREEPELPLGHDSTILKIGCRFTNTNVPPAGVPRHTSYSALSSFRIPIALIAAHRRPGA